MTFQEYRFRNVASLINGRAYLMPELQDSGKYKIVRVGNFTGKDEWFFSDMELEPEKYCENGDLLYKWACTFGPEIWKGDKTIYHYHIWKVLCNPVLLDKTYFFYYLKYYTPLWLSGTNGATMVHITKASMEKKKLYLPTLPQQQKIASILSAYDSQIEINQKRIKLLEQMAENLYKEWFVRFRFPGYETAEFEGGVPKGWVSLVGDNKKPKGWTYGELNQLGTFIRGKNITAAEMIEGQVPVISAGLEPAGYHNQANVCGPCLTISSSGANAGYLKYNLTDIWAADCSYYNNPDNIWFVYSSLKYLQPVISNLQCGAAQPHVYPKDVNRLCVILPPKSLITEYNRQSSLFFKNIHNLKNQIFLLTHQRDLLLPRLMSGKLSI